MIKVVGEKVVRPTDAYPLSIKVKKLKGLGFYSLPYEYRMKEPYCYFEDRRVYIRTADFRDEICEGSYVSQETWQKMITALHQCGNRLMKINEKLRKEAEGWSGTIEVEI